MYDSSSTDSNVKQAIIATLSEIFRLAEHTVAIGNKAAREATLLPVQRRLNDLSFILGEHIPCMHHKAGELRVHILSAIRLAPAKSAGCKQHLLRAESVMMEITRYAHALTWCDDEFEAPLVRS
jgi:hypothetical protein